MVFAEHRPGDELRPGAFGIPAPQGEPADAAVVAAAIAFVPVVAWDDAGGRIGRGGGPNPPAVWGPGPAGWVGF
jgi:5-formyltetrahydrofolate cyclo-ligase